MVTDVTLKLTTPLPELLALNSPVNVAEKLSDPAIGTVCVIVRVKVPDAAITPLPLKNVWKFPKLEPVGVFKLVDPRPVNVIIRALPIPPKKVTELVPLPEQPAHVNVPDVVNVTGSAFAVLAATERKTAATASIKEVFKKILIAVSSELSLPAKPKALLNTPNRLRGGVCLIKNPRGHPGILDLRFKTYDWANSRSRRTNEAVT